MLFLDLLTFVSAVFVSAYIILGVSLGRWHYRWQQCAALSTPKSRRKQQMVSQQEFDAVFVSFYFLSDKLPKCYKH